MSPIERYLCTLFSASTANAEQTVQTLWSGYGSIIRYQLSYPEQTKQPQSIIVKSISPPDSATHPRGWNTQRSHQRKLKSYQVEKNWYQQWAKHCPVTSPVAECYGVIEFDERNQHTLAIVLEDLDASGYPRRHQQLTVNQTKPCLQWLANFHATFLKTSPSPQWSEGLWATGTYWHLDTRPDEYKAMAESPLKQQAQAIDQRLNDCRYKTLVHGDAKVANFCFSDDDQQVAAVDFQYVGGGCGMKDVIYFLGSCLSEYDCQQHHQQLLNFYFEQLQSALIQQRNPIDFKRLEKEWRSLYTLAWADFQRFLLGWSPQHAKNNDFIQAMAVHAIKQIDKYA